MKFIEILLMLALLAGAVYLTLRALLGSRTPFRVLFAWLPLAGFILLLLLIHWAARTGLMSGAASGEFDWRDVMPDGNLWSLTEFLPLLFLILLLVGFIVAVLVPKEDESDDDSDVSPEHDQKSPAFIAVRVIAGVLSLILFLESLWGIALLFGEHKEVKTTPAAEKTCDDWLGPLTDDEEAVATARKAYQEALKRDDQFAENAAATELETAEEELDRHRDRLRADQDFLALDREEGCIQQPNPNVQVTTDRLPCVTLDASRTGPEGADWRVQYQFLVDGLASDDPFPDEPTDREVVYYRAAETGYGEFLATFYDRIDREYPYKVGKLVKITRGTLENPPRTCGRDGAPVR